MTLVREQSQRTETSGAERFGVTMPRGTPSTDELGANSEQCGGPTPLWYAASHWGLTYREVSRGLIARIPKRRPAAALQSAPRPDNPPFDRLKRGIPCSKVLND